MEEKLQDYYSVIFEPKLLTEIIKFGKFTTIKKNELLIDVGGKITHIPLLLNGAIKIVREAKNGDEIVLYFLERGDTCAISFVNCLNSNLSKVRGIAEKDSEVIFLPIKKLEEWMAKYKSWREFIIDSYSIRLDEMIEIIDTLAFMKMDRRLLKYLQDKVKIMRDPILSVTHLQIALDLNTSRVVVSRLLKQLENEGKIKLFRKKIEVLEY
ncbi:MAG: Crp/Fnr family transcriptional regulator [Flavobacteriaceae bacterium]|nr:Crp/Fnr family transcriptional regulator [Flavobacteriaceae bacterium]